MYFLVDDGDEWTAEADDVRRKKVDKRFIMMIRPDNSCSRGGIVQQQEGLY